MAGEIFNIFRMEVNATIQVVKITINPPIRIFSLYKDNVYSVNIVPTHILMIH